MLCLKLLWAFGVWRTTTPTTAFKHSLYTCYTVFMIISEILHIGSEVAGLFLLKPDLKNFTSILCIMLTGTCGFMKMLNLLARRSQILDLLKFRSEFLRYHNLEHPAVKFNIKHERQLSKLSLAFWTSAVVTWLLVPVVGRISGGHPELPFLAWFPFDIEVPFYWGVAWMFQMVTGVIAVAITAAADCLCVAMMTTLRMELKILRENLVIFADEPLKSVGNKMDKLETVVMTISEHEDLTRDPINTRLSRCVEHHQLIISMAQMIQGVYSPVLFMQFMGSSLILCMVGFQATLPSMDIAGLFKCIMYLGVAVLQLLLFCKYGDDVLEESTLVQEAAYGSQWFSCRQSIKKSLLLIIMRAQRPVTLTAAGFYTVSLETFAKLLNASYTYFALLQQLNE